ncbi:MAG: beta-ketoacyl-[acyl-carrier-protein] synthase family protein [Myxococcales bacterium]|nr:beta-ketoacyl-[acyl-carrier-protein] synthase family protein [Myxococcales bacterium]
MPDSPIVITGLGCVTPLGANVAETWAGCLAGANAIAPITRFDAHTYPCTFAAEIRNYAAPRIEGRFARWCDDKSRFALAAAREALADAGLLDARPDPHRFGVSVGAVSLKQTIGDIAARLQQVSAEGPERAYRATDPKDFVVMSASYPATMLAGVFDARGPNLTTSTACTSSAQSVADALRILRRGDADVMLAGGTDRLVEELMVMGFGLLGALSTRNDDPAAACRPFDRTRDGFVLGEGAGFLVLETLEHAQRRGARIRAELLGYGCSANAWRITDSPPDGRGARQSMQAALLDAELRAEQIDYINAHGTSTQQNDASETAGIRGVFGDGAARLPVSSTKSMMGHLVAACAAVELIVCVKAIEDGMLPPTINYEFPDPECDLDCVPNVARKAKVDIAMSNAFGFGGSNGTLIVGRPR